MNKIILFDGVCNLCNSSVKFIIKRDPERYFQFASLQSNMGQKLIEDYGIPEDKDSFILIDADHFYMKSSAALRVARHLRGGWSLLYPFIIVPAPIRNLVYDLIARNRYRLFGKKEECMIPTPEMRERFLD